jgi:hypothetical protein
MTDGPDDAGDDPDDAGDDKFCGAEKRNGKPCERPKGWGTSHPGVGRCKLHGGSTPNHEKAAQVEIAKRECVALGLPIDTTPADALMEEVREACGNVAFYRELVQQLPTHPADDVLVPAVEVEGEDGKSQTIPAHWERGDPGIYGRTYHVSGIPTGEAKPHVLLQLYNDERKRKLEAATAALRAGIEERQVRIAEADAERIETANVRAFTAMGLADRLEEFRGHFYRFLAGDEPAHLGAAGAG